jgi:dienelactone hydrolase
MVRLVVVVMGAALLVASGFAIASSPPANRAVLSVSPRDALLDQRITVSAGNLTPGARVQLAATVTDAHGRRWRSQAAFKADTDGNVVTSQSPSVGGTYRGTDGMGLFWSMREVGSKVPPAEQTQLLPPVSRTRISLIEGGRTVAATTVVRRAQRAGVRESRTSMARQGFVGCFYSPPAGSKRPKAAPAVMLLAGSEGGPPCDARGQLLASHGYPMLAVAYFGARGLPKHPEEIPLEYFERALRWLGSQPGVDPSRLMVIGVSRGAQAALLLGAEYPSLVHAVGEYVGSNVVNAAPNAGGVPAWTMDGKPIPVGSAIPIWKTNGPLFLVGADDDTLGLSADAVTTMANNLSHHHRHDTTALTYPEAGHLVDLMLPYLPLATSVTFAGSTTSLGGTLAGNEAARADSWPKLLGFLKRLG